MPITLKSPINQSIQICFELSSPIFSFPFISARFPIPIVFQVLSYLHNIVFAIRVTIYMTLGVVIGKAFGKYFVVTSKLVYPMVINIFMP